MIVVKTKTTLRIKENNRKKLVPLGSIFRGRTIEDLPKWLQDHITYFRSTARCDTLLITETAEIEQPITPKGGKEVKTDVIEAKTENSLLKEAKPLPEIKPDDGKQPDEVVELPVKVKEDPPEPEEVPPELKKAPPEPKEVPPEPKKTVVDVPDKKNEKDPVKLKKRTPK